MSHTTRPVLTLRQRQILEPLLRGMGQKGVAHLLNLSVNTVHHHVTKIYRAYGVRSLAELAACLAEQGRWDGNLKDMDDEVKAPSLKRLKQERLPGTTAATWERPRMRLLF